MKLALFDVDGTLVDSKAMIAASVTAAFVAEKLAVPPREAMLRVVGLSLVDAMRTLAPGEETLRHERLAVAYKEAFWQFRNLGEYPENLFEGARELLEALHIREDVMLGIATGKSHRGALHLIETYGFQGWFTTVQTSDDHPSKPHPAMVEAALAETGCEPEAAIVIGDTSYDIGMARAAGVRAAGVTWGNHGRAELEQAGALIIVSDFNELRMSLESLWQDRAA